MSILHQIFNDKDYEALKQARNKLGQARELCDLCDKVGRDSTDRRAMIDEIDEQLAHYEQHAMQHLRGI